MLNTKYKTDYICNHTRVDENLKRTGQSQPLFFKAFYGKQWCLLTCTIVKTGEEEKKHLKYALWDFLFPLPIRTH